MRIITVFFFAAGTFAFGTDSVVSTPTAETEFGNKSRESSFSVPILKVWSLEANTYRTEEKAEGLEGRHYVGFVGGSHRISLLKEHLQFFPGFGVLFGSGEPTGSAFKGRGLFKAKWFVSELSVILGFRSSVESHHDLFVEGHASARIPVWKGRHMEGGMAVENIAYHNRIERVYGLRAFFPIAERVSIGGKALTQHDFRIAIAFSPKGE